MIYNQLMTKISGFLYYAIISTKFLKTLQKKCNSLYIRVRKLGCFEKTEISVSNENYYFQMLDNKQSVLRSKRRGGQIDLSIILF